MVVLKPQLCCLLFDHNRIILCDFQLLPKHIVALIVKTTFLNKNPKIYLFSQYHNIIMVTHSLKDKQKNLQLPLDGFPLQTKSQKQKKKKNKTSTQSNTLNEKPLHVWMP